MIRGIWTYSYDHPGVWTIYIDYAPCGGAKVRVCTAINEAMALAQCAIMNGD